MPRRWVGPLIVALILGGVVLVVVMNLDMKGASRHAQVPAPPPPSSSTGQPSPGPARLRPAGFREYPIGDPVEQHQMRIAAVWLPPIHMDGELANPGSDLIHLEADVHATQGNRNGFAKDEFVPYLKIQYQIVSTGGGSAIHQGELMPMVAVDGLHYGASVAMPKAGSYQLIYDIKPPSAGGLGRHSDPITGVDPWWEPFQIVLDWDYPGPPKTP